MLGLALTSIVQVFPEHRLSRIETTVDDVHEQAFICT